MSRSGLAPALAHRAWRFLGWHSGALGRRAGRGTMAALLGPAPAGRLWQRLLFGLRDNAVTTNSPLDPSNRPLLRMDGRCWCGSQTMVTPSARLRALSCVSGVGVRVSLGALKKSQGFLSFQTLVPSSPISTIARRSTGRSHSTS
jgi:hypothetical protein